MRSKRFTVIVSISVLFLGAIVMLRLRSQSDDHDNQAAVQPVTVVVSPAAFGKVSDPIRVTGSLEGIHETDVVSETSGKIVKISAEVDDYLPKGGLIASVENSLQEISLEQAEGQSAAAQANSDKAELDLKRVRNLFAENAVSEAQLENAQLAAKAALAQLKGAEASARLAKKNYDDTSFRTPIAGRLAERLVSLGQMIVPGTRIGTVVDDSRMKLKVGVPEEEVSSVSPGDRVSISVDAVPNRSFEGTVTTVALKADRMTRTFQVEIVLPNDRDRSLKSGMFARAAISTGSTQSTLVVPVGALVESSDSRFGVFVVHDSTAVLRHVSLGSRNDSLASVLSGINPGDLVVTFGQQNLKDGSKVRYSSGS